MYIGAWTEYRLAQEQLLNRRRRLDNADDDAPQQSSYPDGSTRKGVGIYHPSLFDKGGAEVTALPDRESFRRTLESALSSNLAADDVEHISRALEPLMQRLPTIGNAAHNKQESRAGAASLNRTRRRRIGHIDRIGTERRLGAVDHARSDAGTRLNPEGAGSARSGVSVASAPPTCSSAAIKQGGGQNGSVSSDATTYCREIVRRGGWVGGGIPAKGVQRSTNVPYLPILVNARNTSDTPSRCAPSCDGDRFGPHNSKSVVIRQRGKNMRQMYSHRINPAITRTSFENPTSSPEEEDAGVKVGGGYDSRKATMLLRMARKCGPGRVKADFQQFWTWGRNAAAKSQDASSSSNKDTQTMASSLHAAAAERSRAHHRDSDKRFKVSARKRLAMRRKKTAIARKNANAKDIVAVRLKVETLERMKEIYMAKDASKKSSSRNHGNGASPSDDTLPIKYDGVGKCGRPHPDETGGISTGISSRKTGSNRVDGTVEFSTSDDYRDQASTPPNSRDLRVCDPHDSNASSGLDGPNVAVPDLELTESRIRLVEKYFGGGLVEGENRREGSPPLSSEEGTVVVALHRHAAGNRAKDVLDTKINCDLQVHNSMISEVDDDDKRQEKGTVDEIDGGRVYGIRSNSVVVGQSLGGGQGERVREGRRRNALDFSTGGCFPRHQGAVPDLPGAFGQHTGQDHSRPIRWDPAGRVSSEVIEQESGTGRQIRDDKDDSRLSLTTREGNRLRGVVAASSPPQSLPRSEANSPCDCPTPGSPAMAPAWSQDIGSCSASLEDLVCWTKGLDFEAAVEGF